MCFGEVARVQAVDSCGALQVDSGARSTSVSAMLLEEPPAVGDWVLVHSGFALARLSAAEAQDSLAVRDALRGRA